MQVTINVTKKNEGSDKVTVSSELVESYIDGYIHKVTLRSKDSDTVLKEYEKEELDKLIGSAISNGKRWVKNGGGKHYYLGDR